MTDDSAQDSDQDDADGSSRSHALRSCFMDEHEGKTGRVTSCFVATLGIVLAIGGTISLLTHVPRLLPTVDAMPLLMDENVDFFPSLGVLVVGLTLIGRKRLADRVVSAGDNVQSLLGS